MIIVFMFTYLLVENINLLNYLYSCLTEIVMQSCSPCGVCYRVYYTKIAETKQEVVLRKQLFAEVSLMKNSNLRIPNPVKITSLPSGGY